MVTLLLLMTLSTTMVLLFEDDNDDTTDEVDEVDPSDEDICGNESGFNFNLREWTVVSLLVVAENALHVLNNVIKAALW
jgi:hypothetical protein